jgi:thiol-disulfide isomerase/thioredoxin
MSIHKPLIIAGLAVAASLAVLGYDIAKVRSSQPAPTKASSSSSEAAASSGPDSGAIKSIRFVSNPQPVPPFLVNALDGQFISTADWHGKVVLVNFWATWCPPCREEIPALIHLQDQYKDRLQIIGVSMDDEDDAENVAKFAKQAGINYPIVMASHDMIAEYGGVPALPTSFVVNTDGGVVQKHVGLHDPAEYEAEVRALLALPVSAKVETFEDTGQIFLKNAELATDLPDVDMKKLTPEQKQIALKRMNSETCTCGCGLTIAQCRINDSTCDISKHLAAQVVKEIASSKGASSASPSQPTAN